MASSMPLPRMSHDPVPHNATVIHHWGYDDQVLPCTKDVATCQYLEVVYWMQDNTMRYTFILCGVIVGILACCATLRVARKLTKPSSAPSKIATFLSECRRKWLLVDAPGKWLFGSVSRLQVLIFAVLLGYLLVFSFVGITYRTWYTPVKGTKVYRTRTGLGGFSNRLGAFAFSLTPFAVMLGMRESILSLVTGVPYQHFICLHRWLGRLIFTQSLLHVVGWTIIEAKLYQPQPDTYTNFMSKQYVIFGIVAMFMLTLLFVMSTKTAIRFTGYEVFKMTHAFIALLYIGAGWGHWEHLAGWMIPSLALIFIDQGLRYLSMAIIHVSAKRKRAGGPLCQAAAAQVMSFHSEVDENDVLIRLDFDLPQRSWSAGQHFCLTFPSLSLLQSHPFTPASLPSSADGGRHSHVYLIRVRKGQTAKIAKCVGESLPVVLAGPYGRSLPSASTRHLLAIAGGSGVTFTLPIVNAALRRSQSSSPLDVIDFVWIIRHTSDLLWIAGELRHLKTALAAHSGLRISIFVTRDADPRFSRGYLPTAQVEAKEEASITTSDPTDSSNTSLKDVAVVSEKSIQSETRIREVSDATPQHDGSGAPSLAAFLHQFLSVDTSTNLATDSEKAMVDVSRLQLTYLSRSQRPDLEAIVTSFREKAAVAAATSANGTASRQSAEVVGSGPQGLGSDLRKAVARNSGDKIGGWAEDFHWDGRE